MSVTNILGGIILCGITMERAIIIGVNKCIAVCTLCFQAVFAYYGVEMLSKCKQLNLFSDYWKIKFERCTN